MTDKNEIVTAIPGGMAKWFKRSELTPRRERTLQVEIMPLNRLLQAVRNENYEITREETQQLLTLNELAVFVFLKSWTLKDAEGNALPIPASIDEVLDIEDRPLYDALVSQAAKLLVDNANEVDEFTVDAVDNPLLPTGDSAA
jgi:ribosomal protein L16 Arg81 hydroxylase